MCCTRIPSYIQGSNYFHAPPSSLRWILMSQKWRISTFHPSCVLYVLFLLCHSGPCVINLLSAHANKTPRPFPPVRGSLLSTVELPLLKKMSPSCSSLVEIPRHRPGEKKKLALIIVTLLLRIKGVGGVGGWRCG